MNARFSLDPPGYAKRVRQLEREGLCTSDAQGVADVEFSRPPKLVRGITRDIMVAINCSTDEALALRVEDEMCRAGVNLSEVTRRQFNREARIALAVVRALEARSDTAAALKATLRDIAVCGGKVRS